MSTLCQVWILSRQDGERLGFTDHDEALSVDGVVCQPQSGLNAAAVETRLGFSHDNSAVQGALDDERLSAADIESGLYSGARLASWQVDWSGSHPPELLRTQRVLSITRRSSGRFEAELVGLAAELEEVTGTVVSRLCRARFGDARCGLNAADFPPNTSCPRTFAACKSFDNTINFRGFPHLIGEDAIVTGPQEGLARDGGSRYGNGPDV